jgi:hypothetical protein
MLTYADVCRYGERLSGVERALEIGDFGLARCACVTVGGAFSLCSAALRGLLLYLTLLLCTGLCDCGGRLLPVLSRFAGQASVCTTRLRPLPPVYFTADALTHLVHASALCAARVAPQAHLSFVLRLLNLPLCTLLLTH